MKIFNLFKKEDSINISNNRVYLDAASATPVKAKVLEEFNRVTKEYFANASSIHTEGERARELLEKMRKDFAYLIRAKKSEVYFVSSATEANNIFIKGVVTEFLDKNKSVHVITSLTEHASILEPIKSLESEKAEVTYLKPDEIGRIKVEDVKNVLQTNTCLVALSAVSSETGTVQNIREMALALQKYAQENSTNKPFLYIDATQAVECETVDVGTLLCDGMTFGARKIGALGGVALLYIKRGIVLKKLIDGGGQESGIKSGTENLALISAFLKTASEVIGNKETREKRVEHLTNLKIYTLENVKSKLSKYGVEVLGDTKYKVFNHPHKQAKYFQYSSPHILLIHVPNILGEEAVLRLDAAGIAVSTASACSILEGSGSTFLRSLGKDKEAKETIRISFSENTSIDDMDRFMYVLERIVEKYQNVLK